MDIVDTFNHLIPTEHLDDALFLGPNLESEGLDEFTNSQHVLEDSLKNMLSDKDPMLGSASTQFCLPVLDNTDPNFQLSSSTVVGLDDIMDVDVKETIGDPNDDDDLILPSKNDRLTEPMLKSLRKSPRLIIQESVRNLRQSTVDKSPHSSKVTGPKKGKSRKDASGDHMKEQNDSLSSKPEQDEKEKQDQVEQLNISSSNSRRSTRLANKEFQETKIIEENVKENVTASEISNDNLVGASSTLNEDGKSEIEHKQSPTSNESGEKIQNEMSIQSKANLQKGSCPITDLLTSHEGIECEKEMKNPTVEKTDINYDKVHEELALLSGAVKCNLGVKGHLDSESNCEIKKQTDIIVKEEIAVETSLDIPEIDLRAISDSKCFMKEESSIMVNEEILQDEDNVQLKGQEVSQIEICKKASLGKKGPKKSNPRPRKSPLQPTASECEKMVDKKEVKLKPKNQKRKKNTNTPDPEPDEKVVIMKKKKTEITKNYKKDIKKKMVKRKIDVKQQAHVESSLKQPLCDGSRESPRPVPAPTYAHAKSMSHSSEKTVTKHQTAAMSKISSLENEVGDQKDTVDPFEEKIKNKKSIPPRLRKSSKSISVDEPQLFIPDNIPTVKKEGADATSPNEKYLLNHAKHCSSCRKLHGNRFMVGCGRCDEWFHGDCVGLSISQAQEMENEDREYICLKCNTEEVKVETSDSSASDTLQKIIAHQELKVTESDKPVTKPLETLVLHEQHKLVDYTTKHKVKLFRKDSGDGRHEPENKDSEIKKHTVSHRKNMQYGTESHRLPDEKHEKALKGSSVVPFHEEKTTKSSLIDKQENKKKKQEKKGPSHSVHPSTPPTPKPSVDQIRQSVRQSLKDILLKRLSESSSKIPEERATKVSSRVEKELFSFYRDTDLKYKNKYRSLMFNLKDPKNNVLYKRVLKGEITPEHLIKMSPEELASRELAAWRQRENRHTIEMIEKEQREVERRPITKITHKGEIEIESEASIKESEDMDNEGSGAYLLPPSQRNNHTPPLGDETHATSEKPQRLIAGLESVVKHVEKEEEIPKDNDESTETTSDTTTQHKNHLFDLNCKICTGRIAPPAEDLSPKKVKIFPGLIHKQSDTDVDNTSDEHCSSTILQMDLLEAERPVSPKDEFSSPSSSEPFSITDIADGESSFLARMTYIWKGFLNMPSVAKFVIKAYPVSGSLENLTEDLPESIQVGGRISPQTVWDYVDKIKAAGTKETCLIRFSPETEEDQISYTLLYSYFSSRKRYGVVANNMRQVKDMYLIPLGASEKIPHFFVPFDGPGLEVHRPNLLLALIIRQKMKRPHIPSLDEEPVGTILTVPSDKKSRVGIADEDDEEDDENDFFNSFTTVLHKNRNRAPLSDTDEPQAVVDCVPEIIKKEPTKPLRFLPGVLVGWENPHSTLDLANNPLPVDDILESLLGTAENANEIKKSVASISNVEKPGTDENIVLKENSGASEILSDVKTAELETVTEHAVETLEKTALLTQPQSAALPSISLKGKPPDVSTEAFLANINIHPDKDISERDILNEPGDAKVEQELKTDQMFPPVVENLGKDSIGNITTSPPESVSVVTKSPKLISIKRDPRQAAVRTQVNLLDTKDNELNRNEVYTLKDKDSGSTSLHKRNKVKKSSSDEKNLPVFKSGQSKGGLLCSSKEDELEPSEKSKCDEAKSFTKDLLIDDTDPLIQFKRALAANKSQAQTSNTPHLETASKNTASNLGVAFSSVRLQQPQFLPLKSSSSAFPFQQNTNYPLQGNPMFPYSAHLPPLLPTPLGIGFPRPPRFQPPEGVLHNPLLAWHATVQLPPHPAHYLGPVAPGPLLGPDQARYQGPQKFYHKDYKIPERRHSDPWDKLDRLSERTFSRGSRGEYRKRLYSESHHSREKRHYKKDSGNDRHGDKDSERSRHRDKDRSHDRERKGRDDSYRERSRSSHDEKVSDNKTHKEGKRTDKSKSEEHVYDKEREKNRDRNRDREELKERERHHKDRDRDHGDKIKTKRLA
ncbi:PHD finger protein 3 isoform X2 [Bombina bombina]|uniref:PHD finger protein 3 isoform X2 n=1 Tax=Bombina bombina TaxID=8345 RepID=UPI00235A6CE4|nr:PHD finger protein 3 isoform X2 [Bombina bombina]